MTTPKDKSLHDPTRNGHCSGCTDPQSEGTHQMGTFEHPDEAPKDKSQEWPYSAVWENGYCVVRDANAPEGNKIMMMVPDDMHWLVYRLNAAYAAGQETRSARTDKIREAAQAVISRWDSSQWEWDKHGGTANLIADLRNALSELEAQPDGLMNEEHWQRVRAAQGAAPSPSVEQRVDEIGKVVEEIVREWHRKHGQDNCTHIEVHAVPSNWNALHRIAASHLTSLLSNK